MHSRQFDPSLLTIMGRRIIPDDRMNAAAANLAAACSYSQITGAHRSKNYLGK